MYCAKNILNFFVNILRDKSTIEYQITERQPVMKSWNEQSCFNDIKTIQELHDLPNPYELLKNPPSKEHWKSSSNERIDKYIENSWKNEINGKSSLK